MVGAWNRPFPGGADAEEVEEEEEDIGLVGLGGFALAVLEERGLGFFLLEPVESLNPFEEPEGPFDFLTLKFNFLPSRGCCAPMKEFLDLCPPNDIPARDDKKGKDSGTKK